MRWRCGRSSLSDAIDPGSGALSLPSSGKKNLPVSIAGALWQIDSGFNVAVEILCDPETKAVIANAVKVAK
jgi:hypothetical protein